MKVLAWREQLEAAAKGEITVPITVTVDLTNLCQANCNWCRFEKYRHDKPTSIPADILLEIPQFLKKWGVQGVLISGGEPLMHPKVCEFLLLAKKEGLTVGLETNGIKLSEENIRKVVLETCHFVEVGLDTMKEATYMYLKKGLANNFRKAQDGIGLLAKGRGTSLRPQITTKFLIHHANYKEMYSFVDMSKSLGVDNVFFTPVYIPHYRISAGVRKSAEWNLRESRKEFEDENFRVYGIVHRVERDWLKVVRFKKCLATPLTGVFGADKIFYLCRDRRGDSVLNLGSYYPFDAFLKRWGSDSHKDIISRISPHVCPQCTQCMTNEILEHVILEDKMHLKFV